MSQQAPVYKFRKLVPRTPPIILLNSPCVTEWEFPADEVYNLSKSFVEASFALADAPLNQVTCWHAGFIASIASIELLTTGGLKLASLDNVPYNTKLTLRPTTAQSDFLSYPAHPSRASIAANASGQYAGSFHRSNARYYPGAINESVNIVMGSMTPDYVITTASLAGAGGGGYAVTRVNTQNELRSINAAIYPTSTTGAIVQLARDLESWTGPASCIPSVYESGLFINFSLPLHFLSGSLFSVDQDLFYDQKIVLRVVWNNGALMGFNADNQDGDNVTALTVAPVISNSCVMLAVQANRFLSGAIREQFKTGGLTLNIPYTTSFKNRYNGGGLAGQLMTFNQRINSAYGRRLLRIYSAIFNSSGDAGGPYYCQNQNFFQTFYTRISSQWDGINLQETVYNESAGEMYRAQRHRLNKSVCGSVQQFLCSPFLLDDWTPWDSIESKARDTEEAGIPLSHNLVNYDVSAAVNQAGADNDILFMSFIVSQKLLELSPRGVFCQ